MCDLSIVIPVFNEEKNLSPLHDELRGVLTEVGLSYEIIFVDDGSSDGSYALLQTLHAQDDRVKVIRFRRNFGQSAAFAAGFDYAHGAKIITLDADGQNNPADIPQLLAKMQEGDYDFVTGWRMNRKESPIRRFLSGAANYLISRSTHIVVHDRGCSLKLFKREVVKNIRLYGQLHRFLPELASMIGVNVAEVPIQDRARRFGHSKYGSITRTPRVLLDLFTVFFLLTFFSSPMRLFGSVGMATGLIGIVLGGGLALAKIYQGIIGGWPAFHAYQIGNRPLLLLAVLLILVATQFMMMGLLGEMMLRVYHESSGRPIYFIRDVLD
ncbi:MAG TPA: glycosyltransferase family 2 protein [Anaerolineales bacterium]|nr:glycosyltransferase family 2 protein [Anaerolineales bacterium]